MNLYLDHDVRWDDTCSNAPVTGCKRKPVVVVRAHGNPMWRWGVCRKHQQEARA